MSNVQQRAPRRAGKSRAASALPTRRRVIDAVAMVVSTCVLLLVAAPIDGDRTLGAEDDIFRFINGLPGWLYPVLWLPMQFGNLVAVPAAAALAAVARRWRLALSLLLAGLGKLIFSDVVKDAVVRHRPGKFLVDVALRGDTPALGQAFVSGHATIAVAIATLAHPYAAGWLRAALWVLAAIVCIGRIYVGAHLPLDVVGGAALGVAIGSALNLAVGVPARANASDEP